jgi:hypothetical protein
MRANATPLDAPPFSKPCALKWKLAQFEQLKNAVTRQNVLRWSCAATAAACYVLSSLIFTLLSTASLLLKAVSFTYNL